jgi:hypothetical protein
VATTNPNVQIRNQFGRNWGNYASATDLPNVTPGGIPPFIALSSLVPLEAGDLAYVIGVGLVQCIAPGVAGDGLAIWGTVSVVPPLSAVLLIGNTSGASNILMVPAQQIDTDAAGTLKLGNVNATGFEIGKNSAPPGTDPMVLINQNGVQIGGSNAGVQYSTTRANRAQFRGNQFGANTAAPGVTGFKSRGATISSGFAGVADLDLLLRLTAIGVAPDNASIPLAALLTFQVPPGGAVPASNYVATEMELQLVPLQGPVNGATVFFKITSQGVPMLRETLTRPPPLPNLVGAVAGLAVTGVAGTIVVANPNVQAGTRVTLTIQPGGAAPTGPVWVSAITAGVGFTIQSVPGDVGVQVYWQLWEGI